MIRYFLRQVFWLVILLFGASSLYFFINAIESQPLVEVSRSITHDDVARIEKIIRANDPRRKSDGKIRTAILTQRDIDLLLDYGLSHAKELSAKVTLTSASPMAQSTLQFHIGKQPLYLNVQADLNPLLPVPALENISIGQVRLPQVVASWLSDIVVSIARGQLPLDKALEYVRTVEVQPDSLRVSYGWDQDAFDDIRDHGSDWLMSDAQRERVAFYLDGLRLELVSSPKGRVSFTQVLEALFQVAERETKRGLNPVVENRAIIFAAGIYVSRMDIGLIMGNSAHYKNFWVSGASLRINNRFDLVQHFSLSAALTVAAGGGFADILGLYKELNDSRVGTGFSFADIAADRAGVRFAQIATESRGSAIALQQHIVSGIRDADIMPAINQLPEGIMELEFKARYKDLDSSEYKIIDDEVERRLQGCSAYLN